MRDYVSISNLPRAAMVAALVTTLSAPRIVAGGMDPTFFIPAAFFCMLLVAGAATAWDKCGGMVGLVPGRRRILVGVMIALGVAAVAVPLHVHVLDPVLRPAVEATGNGYMIEMRYPSTPRRALALVLWTASFEVLFFTAATMAFYSRLANRLWFSVTATAVGQVLVFAFLLTASGITQSMPLFLVTAAAYALISSLLYARTGLVPTMVLAACVNLHVFF